MLLQLSIMEREREPGIFQHHGERERERERESQVFLVVVSGPQTFSFEKGGCCNVECLRASREGSVDQRLRGSG